MHLTVISKHITSPVSYGEARVTSSAAAQRVGAPGIGWALEGTEEDHRCIFNLVLLLPKKNHPKQNVKGPLHLSLSGADSRWGLSGDILYMEVAGEQVDETLSKATERRRRPSLLY